MKVYVFWTSAVFILSDVFVVLLWLQACSQYLIYQQQFHTHCMVSGEVIKSTPVTSLVLNCFDSPFWLYSLLLLSPVLVTCQLKKKAHFSLLIMAPINQQNSHPCTLQDLFKKNNGHYIMFHKNGRCNIDDMGQVIGNHTKESKYHGSRAPF